MRTAGEIRREIKARTKERYKLIRHFWTSAQRNACNISFKSSGLQLILAKRFDSFIWCLTERFTPVELGNHVESVPLLNFHLLYPDIFYRLS
jgi:hypothetical protein